MARKELEIKTFESENGKIFVLNQNIKGFSEYQKAKAISNFIDKETRVLEMAIETYLRHFLRENDISIEDGSKVALERAFLQLEQLGKHIVLIARYCEMGNEHIVGEGKNEMTCICEDDILSCAIEVVFENV